MNHYFERVHRPNQPVFIIAELSGNHDGSYDKACRIIDAAADCGADAIKLQTYTADTITLNCSNHYFQITQGTLWDGRTLYDLYQEAYTPWEWQPGLKAYAESKGLICFSSPFDFSAIDFLETIDVPCYKIASFEINDIPLIEYAASKGKPMILSTGVATLEEIHEAIDACYRQNNRNITLLKCTSAYPTPLSEVNLRTIADMKERFGTVVGISDHTPGGSVATAAVALGAQVIEKHLTLCRADGGVDSGFSMEPQEFRDMVHAVRSVEQALGSVTYELTESQRRSCDHKRSLFVAQPIAEGELFTPENVRSVRPSQGLPTKYIDQIIGHRATRSIEKGTPLSWDLVER